MDNIILNFSLSLGSVLGSINLSILMLVFLYLTILFLWKYFGKDGLYLYNILAVVIANIQVLKVAPFVFNQEPIALGTLLFASTFITSDIITEHCGIEAAKKSILLSFFAQIITTVLMLFTIAYPLASFESLHQQNVQDALCILFIPSFRILVASLSSYCLCQWVDIKIFQYLKDYTHKKFLWLRTLVSNLASGLLDNIFFSVLAWIVLNPEPISLETLIFTYILGTYYARIIVSVTSAPILYLTYKFSPLTKY